FQPLYIHFVIGHADADHGLGHFLVILLADGPDEFGHGFPGLRADAAHDAEIDEADATVTQYQQVAGVNIRVEGFAEHQAGEPGVHGGNQHRFRVFHDVLDAVQISERYAIEPLHGQHPHG